MVRKRRDQSKQIAIVVLEGAKIVSCEITGVAPLCRAMQHLVNPDDEIIVLTLLPVKTAAASEPSSCLGQCNNQSCEAADSYIKFLHEEISQRKVVYLRIFRPFYNTCKSNGVKFQVKIAAGFRPKDIIIEEANNVRATWIVMDRCFAKHLTFRLSGTDCKVYLVSDHEEAIVHCLQANGAPGSSASRDIAQNPKSPKLRRGSTSVEVASAPNYIPAVNSERQPCSLSRAASICNEEEDERVSRAAVAISHETTPAQQNNHDSIPTRAHIALGQPLLITWEVVVEITQGFQSMTWNSQNRNCTIYYGYLEDRKFFVLVKRYKGNSSRILEAEKKAAQFLQHRNIISLIGYHRNEHDTILVFPVAKEGILDKHLPDLSRKQSELTFKDKLKIAIGIAHGIRYMHEECPRGPVAHGELQPSNIFLTSDMQPMITGFEHATWLQLEQESAAFTSRYHLEDSLDRESMVLIKADIFSFGVLLLRLFCKRSVPQDDKILIEWARPLLLDRAFHLLLDEESDDLDIHGIYRVMSAARMCTMRKPISRPSMSEVICMLKGESFCIIQSSPSDTSA